RLLDEHLDERRIARQVRQDPLDDEGALEALRTLDAGLVYLGHAATADELEERILAELNRLAELGACQERPAQGRAVGSASRGVNDSDPAASPQMAMVSARAVSGESGWWRRRRPKGRQAEANGRIHAAPQAGSA